MLHTLTSIISFESESELNFENGMNFIIPNFCLEASFFERECAPKITLKDRSLADLKKAKRIEATK